MQPEKCFIGGRSDSWSPRRKILNSIFDGIRRYVYGGGKIGGSKVLHGKAALLLYVIGGKEKGEKKGAS